MTHAPKVSRPCTLVLLALLGGCAGASSTTTFFDLTRAARALDEVRAALPGYVFWDETRYGENDPGYPIPTVCAGATRADCEVEIVVERDRVASIVLRSPALEGPAGTRVGAHHAMHGRSLVDCHVGLGDAEGIFCDLDGHPNVGVELAVPGMYDTMPTSEVPTPEQLARATIARIVWHPVAR